MSENHPEKFTPQNPHTGHPTTQTIIIRQDESKTNGIGIAGFIISLIGLFVSWIPFFGWSIWLVGLVLSFIGLFRAPRGLAIAGLVISFICVIILILFVSAIFVASEMNP